jgi:hypothetical protein
LGVDEPVVDGDGGQPIVDLDPPVIAQPSNAGRPVIARPNWVYQDIRFVADG